MAHPNEELVRKGYDAFSRGDMDTLRNEIFAPDIVFHVPGNSPLAGDYRGFDEVLGFFGRLDELSGGTFKIEVHDVLANDEHVVSLDVSTAEREGKRLEDKSALVQRVKDGKLVESWVHPADPPAFDEFWS